MTLCEPLGTLCRTLPCFGKELLPAASLTREKPRKLPKPDSSGRLKSKADGLKTEVFFRWYLKGVKPSEEVRVIGDCLELGDEGVALSCDEGAAACWRSPGIELPLRRPVEYQYVVIEKATGKNARPDLGEERRTVMPTGIRHVIEDDGGAYRDVEQGDTEVCPRSDTAGFSSLRLPSEGLREKASSDPHLNLKGPGSTKLQRLEASLIKEKQLQLTSKDTVVAVFRMLPVRVERDESGGWRVTEKQITKKIPVTVVGLLGQSQAEGKQPYKISFVGQPGVFVEDPEERKQIRELLAPYNCIPVFVDQDAAQQHIQVCHRFLWPLFHNCKVFQSNIDQKIEDSQWKVFKDVNKAYADATEAALVNNSTLVWVHDYHLILVPRLLFKRRDLTLGFMLHCGFPSSEVWRCIPMRVEILQSLLSCHCLTFQIFEYARHFLSCCKVILNCDYSFQEGGVLQVQYDDRSIVIRTDHVVIPWDALVKRVEAPYVQTKARNIRSQFPHRTILASIDGDEPFAGMTLKLRAFQKFVADCPQHRQKVALVQYIVVSSGSEDSSREHIELLRKMADDINQTYGIPGDPPLVTIKTEESDIDDRLAILLGTDCLLDTSINDGLNLYPFMFYCAHMKDRQGAVIVSEFTGCSSVLTGAVKVNPWNTKATMEAMHTVITLDATEQANMFEKDHSYVSTQTFDGWVEHSLLDIKASKDTGSHSKQIFCGSDWDRRFMASVYRALNIDSVVLDYRQSKHRLIFLDNEGTISPDRRAILRYGENSGLTTHATTCDDDTLECIQNLASDQRNIVVVISGREKEVMDEVYGHIPNLGMCAEHGFYWTSPGRLQGALPQDRGTRWHSMRASTEEDNDWKTIVIELFRQYTKRVQGSIIERRGNAVAWDYHEVGAQDFAQVVALELARLVDPSEPGGLMSGYPVRVVSGKGYVEVKKTDVDKGMALKRVLQQMQQQELYVDFALVIGDDRSDEDMFVTLHDWCENEGSFMPSSMPNLGMAEPLSPGPGPMRRMSTPTHLGDRAAKQDKVQKSVTDDWPGGQASEDPQCFYTATVGRKPSSAKYFVKDSNAVQQLLQKLAKEGIRTKFSKFSSVPDLAQLALMTESLDSLPEIEE